MPNMTGLEFIENQRKKGCKVPCMAIMSGSWTDAELEQAESLDCNLFRKPFGIDVINRYLDECEIRIVPDRTLSDFPYMNQHS